MFQFRGEKPGVRIPPAVRLEEEETITEEAVTTTLARAMSFCSTIQAQDGHWPSECTGGLVFLPPLVSLVNHDIYITVRRR